MKTETLSDWKSNIHKKTPVLDVAHLDYKIIHQGRGSRRAQEQWSTKFFGWVWLNIKRLRHMSQISKYVPHKVISVFFELVKKMATPATLDLTEPGFESAGLECILILLMAHFWEVPSHLMLLMVKRQSGAKVFEFCNCWFSSNFEPLEILNIHR